MKIVCYLRADVKNFTYFLDSGRKIAYYITVRSQLRSTPTDGATDVVVAASTNRLQVAVSASLKNSSYLAFSGSAQWRRNPHGHIINQVESACAVDPCGQ
jgi:hypothetical protein